MPEVKCKICGKNFHAKPSWLKRGHGKYCSMLCKRESQKNGKVVKCFICSKDTYKRGKALVHSKSGKYFCTKSCQTKWRNAHFHGAEHPNYKDGLYAYRSVLVRNKVMAVCLRCKTTDKRILAVHHIDQNRKNNTLKNLTWLCHNCHHLIHQYPEERKKIHV